MRSDGERQKEKFIPGSDNGLWAMFGGRWAVCAKPLSLEPYISVNIMLIL